MLQLSDEIKEWFTKDYSEDELKELQKKYTLSQLMISFYECVDLTDLMVKDAKNKEPEEVAEYFELTSREYNTWKTLYFGKNGMFA